MNKQNKPNNKKRLIITITSLLVILGVVLGITLWPKSTTTTKVSNTITSNVPQMKDGDKKLSFEIINGDDGYKVKESTSYLDKTISYINKEIKDIKTEDVRIVALDSSTTNLLSKMGVPLVAINNSPFLVSSLTENRIKYDDSEFTCDEGYEYFTKTQIKNLIQKDSAAGCYSVSKDEITLEEDIKPTANKWPRNDLDNWEIQNIGFPQKIDKDVINAVKPDLIVYSTQYANKFPEQIEKLKTIKTKKLQVNLYNEQDHFALLSTIGKKFGSQDETDELWDDWATTFEEFVSAAETQKSSEKAQPKTIFLYRLRNDVYQLGSDSFIADAAKQMNASIILPSGSKTKKIALSDLKAQNPKLIVHLIHPIRSKEAFEDNSEETDYLFAQMPDAESFYSTLGSTVEYNSPTELRKIQEFIINNG